MNYGYRIREALTVIECNHTGWWHILTEDSIVNHFNQQVMVALILSSKKIPKTGSLGQYKGQAYVFHKSHWRKVIFCKNGKARLE